VAGDYRSGARLCATALHLETHGGAEVLRCAACVGAFVPRASLDVIARSPSRDHDTPPDGWLRARVARLEAWLT
jgi:cytosine/adenosine deaminase-related metal-dependent hydrolase